MSKTIILRFRDLVTELGGTITEHQALLRSQGEVWWGWWMRQHEDSPRQLFGELLDVIEEHGSIRGFVLDAGTDRLYSCLIADIRVAPTQAGIGSPDPEKSPEYYNRGRYPAWFLLRSLENKDLNELQIVLDSLPTKPELDQVHCDMLNRPVTSLQQLRALDVTLWVVKTGNNSGR